MDFSPFAMFFQQMCEGVTPSKSLNSEAKKSGGRHGRRTPAALLPSVISLLEAFMKERKEMNTKLQQEHFSLRQVCRPSVCVCVCVLIRVDPHPTLTSQGLFWPPDM